MFGYGFRRAPLRSSFGAAVALLAFAAAHSAAADTTELNALVWCDHTDPALLQPFEEANNVKVNVKEYDGTGTALALLEQSQPGDWDVFVVDATDLARVAGLDILAPLDPADYPWDDIPEKLRDPKLLYVNDQLYGVPEKFGYVTVAYDKSRVDPADMRDGNFLWDPKYKGRIAVYDYYLPVMGLVGLVMGKTPEQLTEADLPALQEKLAALKANSALVGDITTVQTALSTGEVDIIVGGGEFIVSGLSVENPNLDWVLPSQGGIRWEQTLGIFKDSTRKDLAKKFIQYILSPDAQAKLATSACFWGMPVNMKATLTPEQKTILRWDEQPGFIEHSYPNPSPTVEFDKKMQDSWADSMQR
jgi:spermidine/putrescine transport system substrate-binding protein